jgi:hypothetical protein
MRNYTSIILLVLAMMLLASCAAGPNEFKNVPDEEEKVAGFWRGLWHGIISPVTFIVSLFNKNINVYEVHNNGGWYNFGFLLGIGALSGGGGSSASRRRS